LCQAIAAIGYGVWYGRPFAAAIFFTVIDIDRAASAFRVA